MEYVVISETLEKLKTMEERDIMIISVITYSSMQLNVLPD